MTEPKYDVTAEIQSQRLCDEAKRQDREAMITETIQLLNVRGWERRY